MLLIVQLLLLLTLSGRTDGYYLYTTSECVSSSAYLSDVEFIETFHFNKGPVLRFNSTVGLYVGYSKFGAQQAEAWNSDPEIIQQMRGELDRYCKNNAPTIYSAILDKSVEPKTRLVLEKQSSGDHPAMLMCSAYDFFPPAIEVSWLIDGIKVNSDVISTEEMADGDWYYQVHSHLEHKPKSGEKISCVVEHVSFKEPLILDWDGVPPESDTSKVAVGASALVLGIVLPIVGLIYYRRKLAGRTLVPS